MTNGGGERTYWRVGYHADPAGFVPLGRCSWNHRFDDLEKEFRSVYAADLPTTALREVLADFRPNTAAIRRYIERFGPEAAADVPSRAVTMSWRQQHVLVEVRIHGEGPLIDLCDPAVCHDIETEYAVLLDEHGKEHLDLPQVTAGERPFTQALARRLFDDHAAAGVRFPSRRDGQPCVALFEHRGELTMADSPLLLTDPPIEPLQAVCSDWRLQLQPAASVAPR